MHEVEVVTITLEKYHSFLQKDKAIERLCETLQIEVDLLNSIIKKNNVIFVKEKDCLIPSRNISHKSAIYSSPNKAIQSIIEESKMTLVESGYDYHYQNGYYVKFQNRTYYDSEYVQNIRDEVKNLSQTKVRLVNECNKIKSEISVMNNKRKPFWKRMSNKLNK